MSLSDAFYMLNWIRASGLVWLPLGLGGVPIAHCLARTGEGRKPGLVAFIAPVIAID